METTTRRFILAASAVGGYVMLLAGASAILIADSTFANASLYQWSLGTVLVFMFVFFMGGLLVVGVSKIGRSFFHRMALLLSLGWAVTPITYGHENIESVTGAILDVAANFLSVAFALSIFYFIAFKPAESETA